MEGSRRTTGALENHTREKAALAGHIGHWTADDCEAARRMANELTYPRGPSQPTPQATFAARQPISAETRAAFRRSVAEQQDQERIPHNYPLDIDLDLKDQDAIDRVAIRRALVQHGIPTFTRRSISPQLESQIPLKVS
jgi:hypothetical protein